MNIVRLTHQLAMEMNTIADVAMAKGYKKEAKKFYKNAFELEREAAFLTSPQAEDPLPHFVLLRGAAALANKAGLYQEAETLIELGHSENPPDWLKEELQEIADLITNNKNNKRLKPIEKTLKLEGIFADINSKERCRNRFTNLG